MSKFHITSKGEVKPCKAIEKPCPLGGQEVHFDDLEKAKEYLKTQSIIEYGLLPTVSEPETTCEPQVPSDNPELTVGQEVHKNLFYVRTDRNGTKIYNDFSCKRCGGAGGSEQWRYTGYNCYACGGSGKSETPQIIREYTPEYEKKLNEKRQLKYDKLEAERLELEAEEKRNNPEPEIIQEPVYEEPYASQHIGEIGEKITTEVELDGAFSFKTQYGTSTIYKLKDKSGNVLIWKTGSYIEPFEGFKEMTSTVKDHSEYNDEKQTNVLRPKFK